MSEEPQAGRELDVLVARMAMGQTDFSHLEPCWFEGYTEDGQDGWDGFCCPRCRAVPGDPGPCVKHYSASMEAAWPIAEKFKFTVGPCEEGWFAGRSREDAAVGITPALAICRAAVKPVEEKGK